MRLGIWGPEPFLLRLAVCRHPPPGSFFGGDSRDAVHLLLALSKISRELYGVDLAAPLFVGRLFDVPPVAALALGLHPRHWHLALWRAEEDCAAPAWPDPAVAIALVAAAQSCAEVKYAAQGNVIDAVRLAAQLDGVSLAAVDKVEFRLLTAEEIRQEVEAWLGEPLRAYVVFPPKVLEDKPKLAAAVALGAYRPAAGMYVAEPQVVALV